MTISAIKADVGGFVGRSAIHPDLLSEANRRLDEAIADGMLIDAHADACGDDVNLVMTHRLGVDAEPVQRWFRARGPRPDRAPADPLRMPGGSLRPPRLHRYAGPLRDQARVPARPARGIDVDLSPVADRRSPRGRGRPDHDRPRRAGSRRSARFSSRSRTRTWSRAGCGDRTTAPSCPARSPTAIPPASTARPASSAWASSSPTAA
jgi:hypothetical protein